MRSCRELHGPGHRVHAHRWIAFQDSLAVHAEDDAVVGACIKVNAFGSRREPHTVPANPVVPGRPVSLVDERKIDGRDAFINDRFGRGVAWVPIAAREPGVQAPDRAPPARTPSVRPLPASTRSRCGTRGDADGAKRPGERSPLKCLTLTFAQERLTRACRRTTYPRTCGSTLPPRPDGHGRGDRPPGAPRRGARVRRAELSNGSVAPNVTAIATARASRPAAGAAVAAASPTCELLSVSGPEAITASTETFTTHIFSRARVATTSPSLRKPRARLPPLRERPQADVHAVWSSASSEPAATPTERCVVERVAVRTGKNS